VQVNGQPAERARQDLEYGIVFPDAVPYDWRTVARNISLPLELLRWSRGRRNARVKDMMELVELTGFESHHPWQLSGGMQQRVSIARALSFSPALLLMDEPFGALDEMTRERMNAELLRIWEETRSTIVFVTHSIAEAVFLSTRVAVMSARPGRISTVIPIDLPQPRTALTREVQRFLLPKPTQIASTFWTDRHALWSAGWFTFQEALGGFVIGSGLAIVVALVLARWRPLGSALMPYAIAANAVPIIAFAPITNA